MKKDRIKTLLILCLTLVVVLGGWEIMKKFLDWQVENFLSDTGQISLKSSGTSLFIENEEKNLQGETIEQDNLLKESLSEDMMVKILNVWESGGRELPHEPKSGQMDMEQAIETGRIWIDSFVEKGVLPKELEEDDYDKISAKLCTHEASVDFDEVLLGYWSVKYMKEDITISLVIHAVYGEVWRAEISMNEREDLLEIYSEEELVELAFPFIEKEERSVVNLTNNTTHISLKEGLVIAMINMRRVQVNDQTPVIEMDLWLRTGKS